MSFIGSTTAYPNVGTLDGSEVLPIVKAGVLGTTTPDDLASFVGGGSGNAVAVQHQTPHQSGKYLGRDGTWRDPKLAGTGVMSVGSSATLVDDSKYNTWPGVCRLLDGRLLIAYTKGDSHHADNTGRAFVKPGTENPDGSVTWGAEVEVHDEASLWVSAVGVSQNSAGRIFVTLLRDDYAVGGTGEAGLVYSDDDGVTWSAWVDLDGPSAFTQESFSAGNVLELPNGDLLVPVEGSNTGDSLANRSMKVVRSTDGGATWGSPVSVRTYAADTRPYYESHLVLLRSGRLLCVHRCSANAGAPHYISASDDYGATWAAPYQAFAGFGKPNTVQLSTGTLVAVTRRDSDQCVIAYTSTDEGRTWGAEILIDSSTDDMMYGAPVELFDGRTLVVYSLERSGSNADILARPLTESRVEQSGLLHTIALTSNGATRALDPRDAGRMHRFGGTGAKSLTIDTADGFTAGTVYHVANRGASGNVTLTPTGVTLNAPKGGSLVLEPGDTVSVHFQSATVADVFGSTQ